MKPKKSTGKVKAAGKALWSQPPQSGVRPQRVIKGLNVLNNVVMSLGSGSKAPQVKELVFQATKEILSNSVIIGASFM